MASLPDEGDKPSQGCLYHGGKSLIYICEGEECARQKQPLACTECVTSIHKGHSLDLLSSRVIDKKEKLMEHIDLIEHVCDSFGDDEERINRTLTENEKETQVVLAAIKNNQNDNIEHIDRITEEKVALCVATGKQNVDTLLKYRSRLQVQRETLRSYLSECKQKVTHGTDIEVFWMKDDTSLPVLPKPPDLSSHSFKKCSYTRDKLKSVCGKLSNEPVNVTEIHVEKQKGFHENTRNGKLSLTSKIACKTVPHKLCAGRNGTFWIRGEDQVSIYRLDDSGKIVNSLECLVSITGMCVSPVTGNVWISGIDGSIREVILPQIVVLRFFVEAVPTTICVTRDENVVVGYVFDIKLYTGHGKMIRTYSEDSFFSFSVKPLYPVKVVQCSSSHRLAVLCNRRSSKTDDGRQILFFSERLKLASVAILGTLEADPIDICCKNQLVLVMYKAMGIIVYKNEEYTCTKAICLKARQEILSMAICGEDSFAVGTENEIRIYSFYNTFRLIRGD